MSKVRHPAANFSISFAPSNSEGGHTMIVRSKDGKKVVFLERGNDAVLLRCRGVPRPEAR